MFKTLAYWRHLAALSHDSSRLPGSSRPCHKHNRGPQPGPATEPFIPLALSSLHSPSVLRCTRNQSATALAIRPPPHRSSRSVRHHQLCALHRGPPSSIGPTRIRIFWDAPSWTRMGPSSILQGLDQSWPELSCGHFHQLGPFGTVMCHHCYQRWGGQD